MNANELANELHLISSQKKDLLDKSIAMLRRQADEITVFHQILGYEGVEVGQEYMDECVAELRKAQEK